MSNINVNMGNLLRTELAVLGTLITLLITTKDMIPYRHSQIYGDMNILHMLQSKLETKKSMEG